MNLSPVMLVHTCRTSWLERARSSPRNSVLHREWVATALVASRQSSRSDMILTGREGHGQQRHGWHLQDSVYLRERKDQPHQSHSEKDNATTIGDSENVTRWTEPVHVQGSSPLRWHQHAFSQQLDETEQWIWTINCRLANSSDTISSLCSCASGRTWAATLSQSVFKIIDCEEFPFAWKGGRAVDLFKGKGDAANTNAHRVPLIQVHMGKVMVEQLERRAISSYHMAAPDGQFGVVSHGGTDVPTLILEPRRLTAELTCVSWAIVFVDFVEAIDNVVSPISFGLQRRIVTPKDPTEIGRGSDQAEWGSDSLHDGSSLLDCWNVDKTGSMLLHIFHTKSGLQYASAANML